MNSQEIAERIAERIIRLGDYSADLSLPMDSIQADRLFTLVRIADMDRVECAVNKLRMMVINAILEVLNDQEK